MFIFKCEPAGTFETYTDKVFVASRPEIRGSLRRGMFIERLRQAVSSRCRPAFPGSSGYR